MKCDGQPLLVDFIGMADATGRNICWRDKFIHRLSFDRVPPSVCV